MDTEQIIKLTENKRKNNNYIIFITFNTNARVIQRIIGDCEFVIVLGFERTLEIIYQREATQGNLNTNFT